MFKLFRCHVHNCGIEGYLNPETLIIRVSSDQVEHSHEAEPLTVSDNTL